MHAAVGRVVRQRSPVRRRRRHDSTRARRNPAAAAGTGSGSETCASIVSTFAMREIGLGISPPISTPSANVRAPPAPAKVSVRMPIARRPCWLLPNMKIAKWLACQTAVASSAYFSLAASILPMVEQAALLTDWMAPTVATDTGAGRVQFTMRAFRRDHRDRPDHALVPDDVVAEQREQRREQAAKRRPFACS